MRFEDVIYHKLHCFCGCGAFIQANEVCCLRESVKYRRDY